MKKTIKKIAAMLLAGALAATAALPAFAEGQDSTNNSTITIERDSTWNPNAESANATYTYYKIFDAVITTAATVDEATGALTSDGNVVYTVDSKAKAEALPDIFEAKLAADGKYYVTLVNENTGAADIVTALKTMVENNPTLFPAGVPVTSDEASVELNVGSDGYYLILASNGKDAAVQTIGNVTIKEKNDYPTIDKKQRKNNNEYADAVVAQEIGKYIDYQAVVHIPADANKEIAVYDTMSPGLEWDEEFDTDGLIVSPEISYSSITQGDDFFDAAATWQIMFDADTVIANRNTDITITYRAKVTEDALVDTGRENEVTLKYDNKQYILKDKVNYTTYFGGIYKVDPNDSTADMSGVKFDLTSGGAAVNVTYDDAKGYYVPGGSSNEVETRSDGDYYTIKIRGLDGDKTYTLTETDTRDGYNLLDGSVNLSKYEDTGTAFADKALDTFNRVENNKGTQLPSTGGMGTTLFYIIGGILVAAAAIILVSKKRAAQ